MWEYRDYTNIMIIINGVRAAQVDTVRGPFTTFFRKEKFDVVIEIGTLYGGFSAFLRQVAGKEIPIHTFDIVAVSDRTTMKLDADRDLPGAVLNQRLVDANVTQHVMSAWTEEGKETIKSLMKGKRSLVMCDGGDKIREVNFYAPELQVGDFIMAHDYGKTRESFKKAPWQYHEIQWSDVSRAAIAHNLSSVYEELFEQVVWLCMRKEA
jgi:hypothetical protein